LKGKCRACRQSISIQYPLVEFMTACLAFGLFCVYGWSMFFAAAFVFSSLLMIASVIDLKMGIIPDEISFWGILIAWALSFFFPLLQHETVARLALANSVLGMLASAALLFLAATLGEVIFKKECMGGGDLKLLAMIGAFLGWEKAILAFLISPILSVPVALIARFLYKRESIAFGPYLAFGGLIAFVVGDSIIHYFFG
jgi:leader peptidase (prepilin peptidase)/N-methyltransferase